MGRNSSIQTSFNGGELSPLIAGRVDVAKFANGCERMENYLPMIQGPAISRPGFVFVAEVKDSDVRTWLVRFEFSVDEAYQLEFGDGYIRFFAQRGQVLDAGLPYEIASPYAAADLTNPDGSLALRFVQTGDVVYLVHSEYPVHKLSRFAATNWTIEEVDFSPPPFKELNRTATTVEASASTGTGITLTASDSIFTAEHVGQYIYLGERDVRDTPLWEAGKSITAGDFRRSDGKNYKALNTATTGGTKPTHSSGTAFDGDASSVQWEFQDAGYGWAKITAQAGTTATADVVSPIPLGATSGGGATERWAFQAWNPTDGYPTAVTFFRERLTFSRGSTIWFSVAADFENFATRLDGQIVADAGFERELSSDRANNIRWLSPGDVLLAGTAGDEWAIVESTTNDPFGPENSRAKPQSTYGSSYVAPVRVADVTLFFQKAGRKVRAMAFRFEEDGFKSDDTTVYASHITKPRIIDAAFQQEPQSIVWCARSDGVLIGMTFNREQDVVAWHRHPMPGGFVECVECIPAPDGGQDDLWVIVRYTINGVTRRYVAYMADIDEVGDVVAQEDWKFSDMCATYSGAPVTTISGLDYLEGQTVWVLTDGAYHPDRVVTGGQISLQLASSKVTVGLPCPGVLETTQLNTGGDDGTAQGKIKRVHQVVVRLLNSGRGKAGPSEGGALRMQGRSPSTPMGSADPMFTGDIPIDWPGGYDRKQTIVVQKDSAMPVNVVAVIPSLQTNTK